MLNFPEIHVKSARLDIIYLMEYVKTHQQVALKLAQLMEPVPNANLDIICQGMFALSRNLRIIDVMF